MVIYPESFSVKPDTEATVGFRNLFNTSAKTPINKNLTLSKGNYVFLSKNANIDKFYITNTIARDEYKKLKAEPNIHKSAVVIDGVSNMEIDFNDSTFIMDGKMTHIVIKDCYNIKLKNLTVETVMPNVHKLTVLKASTFYATFKVDDATTFVEEKGEFYWVGTDYKMKFTDYTHFGWCWYPTAKPDNFNHTNRSKQHPFFGATSVKQIAEKTFTVRYIYPVDFVAGQIFYAFPCTREEVGIFVENSDKIALENIKQTYNNSLAFVAQNSSNITIENVDFSPNKKYEVDFCSVADFLQFSMCRGKIAVRNSNFDNAGDDVCNVHGFHFEIVSINHDKITVKFCHPQSYGFECIREGDTIAFVNPNTLLEVGRTKVLKAELRDEYFYDLTLTTYDVPVGVGYVIENISANPDFEFKGNTVNRIVTRGVLCTTRGKILIEDNKFLNTGMSGILISDDANYWYESGPVRDVTIRGNAFMNCEENAILIKPEIKKYQGSVHKNILIENNLFVLNNTHALNVSCTENVIMRGNTYAGTPKYNKWVAADRVEGITTDCPK